MNDKKQIIKMSAIVLGLFAVILSVTYAFINVQLTGSKKQVITAGTLDLILEEDENNLTITDALPMYDDVGMIQDAFTFRLINNVSTPTNYILKLTDITTGNKLPTSIVKYGLTKNGVGEPKLLSTLPEDGQIDAGVIGDKETIEYTLRLWIDASVTDNTVISGKSLSYRIDVEVSQEIEKATLLVKEQLFESANLGENCKTYDDGTDTFLVGQCSNNYVWYSGKLWRAVLKNNETGVIKLVTDNAITAIAYNDEGNANFEYSYVDQWLNQEFLPTLHDYNDYLVVDSVWDVTEDSSDAPTRPVGTTTVERTVGLLNIYEYYTTYASSDNLATFSTTYLNNSQSWWSITPYDTSSVNVPSDSPYFEHSDPMHNNRSVRPSINLKSEIKIDGGTGIKTDPYILKGDMQETVNGTTLLSTRYSGEYITFNNELYRIVDTENSLTKITAVDNSSELSNNAFDNDEENYIINFSEADIKQVLENYYQDLESTWKEMIQTNTIWYLGSIGFDTSYNYKASVCETVDASESINACTDRVTSTAANIALPRFGEMFTSQITRKTKDISWTLTPFVFDMTELLWYISYASLDTREPYLVYTGVRPSMYLKSNVVIASDNTGNGTYEKPYSIELAS